ncbi:bifunctional proline dehydrogenase/L-glutamate gamma-semialdehyde dehydrogenase PutA [Hyphococcus lacteus]|uniref:Bifunctional protein PutA n=1 Tax=Hyphococcus lacteus TaxID=3143536 RepID=A0ABV3Z7H6_9PROT
MPFEQFSPQVRPQSLLRRAITAAYRQPEQECISKLLPSVTFSDQLNTKIETTARSLVKALRAGRSSSGLDDLIQEYALSSDEGIALMCLAEALLRIPDEKTRDCMIKDKIAPGNWQAHLGKDRSVFVNSATWGLVVTGKLVRSDNDAGLSSALTRTISRSGQPIIRKGVEVAMNFLGDQFVAGKTISMGIKRARHYEKMGFLYSYDMLGEAAVTAEDATAYYNSYRDAIRQVGEAARGESVYDNPGISIKLSALHPRYERAKASKVLAELLPRVQSLAKLAKFYNIGMNIDAEEADRLELSLDLFESLALDTRLTGWDGLGFVAQAYSKRCPEVIDWLADLAKRSNHRFMVRLVKGAYWDTEIKQTQVDGLDDFPVYTRKAHTDISYLACAKKLLDARNVLFPQFATHNAHSLSAIYHMAGHDYTAADYEFQCLHGMGERLYSEIVGPQKLARPCRIYAPIGTHETLLAYLVRRLLENGANSSFVNLVANPEIEIEDLVTNPVNLVQQAPSPGAPHSEIRFAKDMFADRCNSSGLDLSCENTLSSLHETFPIVGQIKWTASATNIPCAPQREIICPGNHRDIVGYVKEALPHEVSAAFTYAASSSWPETSVADRAACLESAAERIENDSPRLLSLIMREAGKTLPNAVAEIREAVDFLRYYANEARENLTSSSALGTVVCISPWNFPLAIFTGQVAAALVAGNTVLAKPAEETPLIAAETVRILHECGIPKDALQLVPGDGSVGAALVDSIKTSGVMFTGSTEVAKKIQQKLATRVSALGQPIPLIAETGGQNAMIVDSSALAEQVVVDVVASAFDSAGQRCSALRILCLQEDIAERTLEMLRGAMSELQIGSTDRIDTDVGPVISQDAKRTINFYIDGKKECGKKIHQNQLPPEAAYGSFVAPTIIEIDNIKELGAEVFGPVLHVIRYKSTELNALIDAINETGYGLTFGLHTRMDHVIEQVANRVQAGNIYINRDTIGAIVGVQPFGGRGLSGTGPKAGGPLYLTKLAHDAKYPLAGNTENGASALSEFIDWLNARGDSTAAAFAREYNANSPRGLVRELPSPAGETNTYSIAPRGIVFIRHETKTGLYQQIAAVLASGNSGLSENPLPTELPSSVLAQFSVGAPEQIAAALFEGSSDDLVFFQKQMSKLDGPIVPIQSADCKKCRQSMAYRVDWLCEEKTISINTTAAGGNASLMTIGM